MDDLLMLLVRVVAYGLVLHTGKLLVWILSLGRWRSERLLGGEHRAFRLAGSMAERLDGRMVVTENGQLVLGTLAWVAVVVWLVQRHVG